MVSVCFNKFFRLPICLGKDSIIVNTGRNSVSSIQFHSHKLMQSWVLKQPQSFSCPVVYHSHENQLLSVIDRNTLIIWDYEADDLDGAKKIKFQDEIFAIVLVANKLLVVFKTGSCLLLEDAIAKQEFLMKSYLKNDEKLLWVDAAADESEFLIFLLTWQDNGERTLHSLSLNAGDGLVVKSSKQILSRNSVSLQSWCIKHGDVEPSFLTIWSDGKVYSYAKDCKSPVHLLSISEITVKEQFAMDALDTCHIVIVRTQPSIEISYEIWDTRYSTKKTSKSFDCTPSENLQVKILGDTLFLPSNQKIVAEPLKVEFSTLAAVVGKSSNDAEVQDVFYSWTSDGKLCEVSSEEEAWDDVSSSTFSTVTDNVLFGELLDRIHHGNAETISSLLREIKLISESKLVKLLKHLLSQDHCKFSEKKYGKGRSSKKAVKHKHVADIFLEFFCIPFDDIFLQQHLRKLSFEKAVNTLEILQSLLKSNSPHTAHDNQSHSWDIELQIIKWISLLKLSHFEEFLHPTGREKLIIANQGEILVDKIKILKEELKKLKCKTHNFEHSTSTNYCVEIAQL